MAHPRKRLLTAAAVVIAAWLPLSPSARACSSFASYANGPLYGMNFDYPADAKVRFVIENAGKLRVFHLTFTKGGDFVPTVGMNSAGLFVSDQIEQPQARGDDPAEDGELYPWQLYRTALETMTSAESVRDYLDDRRLVHDPTLRLHLLVADRAGGAFVAEVGWWNDALIDRKGDFIVMTNFPNRKNERRDCSEVEGVGADRYEIICRELTKSARALDVDDALALLSKARNRSPQWPTRCSLVFDPARGEVFIAIERDYDRIWKASLASGTVETHRGFDRHRRLTLDASGVLASELQ